MGGGYGRLSQNHKIHINVCVFVCLWWFNIYWKLIRFEIFFICQTLLLFAFCHFAFISLFFFICNDIFLLLLFNISFHNIQISIQVFFTGSLFIRFFLLWQKISMTKISQIIQHNFPHPSLLVGKTRLLVIWRTHFRNWMHSKNCLYFTLSAFLSKYLYLQSKESLISTCNSFYYTTPYNKYIAHFCIIYYFIFHLQFHSENI